MVDICSIYGRYMVDDRHMAGIWSIDIWQTERVGKSKEEGSNKEDNPHVQLKCHQNVDVDKLYFKLLVTKCHCSQSEKKCFPSDRVFCSESKREQTE